MDKNRKYFLLWNVLSFCYCLSGSFCGKNGAIVPLLWISKQKLRWSHFKEQQQTVSLRCFIFPKSSGLSRIFHHVWFRIKIFFFCDSILPLSPFLFLSASKHIFEILRKVTQYISQPLRTSETCKNILDSC